VRVLAERREGPDYGNVAVTGDLDFGVITENYGRFGFRTATEMHNQAYREDSKLTMHQNRILVAGVSFFLIPIQEMGCFHYSQECFHIEGGISKAT